MAQILGKPVFFATPAQFRTWLEAHHQQQRELWGGFYKRSSGRPSITWPEFSSGWDGCVPPACARFNPAALVPAEGDLLGDQRKA